MQQNPASNAERRASSPTIFNLLQDQSLMANNNDDDENEEEKKQENEEKQENHDDDDDNDAPNTSSNNAEDDLLGIDDEKTSETKATDMMAVMQQTQEIPEDEKQSPTNHNHHDSVIDDNEECSAKPSEDQKVNFQGDEEENNVLTTIKDDDDDDENNLGDSALDNDDDGDNEEQVLQTEEEEDQEEEEVEVVEEDEDNDVEQDEDEDEDEREETEVQDDDDDDDDDEDDDVEDEDVEEEEEEEEDVPQLLDESKMMTQSSNANHQDEDEDEQEQHVPQPQEADEDDDDNETTTNTSNDEGLEDALEPLPTPLQAPQPVPIDEEQVMQNGDVNHDNDTTKPQPQPQSPTPPAESVTSASVITMSDSQLFGTPNDNKNDNDDNDQSRINGNHKHNDSNNVQMTPTQTPNKQQNLSDRERARLRVRPQRKKWPRDVALNRLHWPQYEPVLDVNMNLNTSSSVTAPSTLMSEQNKQNSLLFWFIHERVDDHILDRYNYRSFAVTAQLIVYPLSYASGQLRVMDRFYHRLAHHFHSAYLNQLRKQTYRATHENISDDVFYPAIGGRDVSRRSLLISTDSSPKVPWIDLDGSPLIPSAIAGIQTNGHVVVFFIRIPEKPTDMLQKKVELRVDTQCKQSCYASVRWHPSSLHTLLVADKNIVRVFHIDRDWKSTTQMSTINLNSLPLLSSPVNRSLTSSPPIMKDKKLSGANLIVNMVIATHYSSDATLLVTLNGPHSKSYGLLRKQDQDAAAFEHNMELQSKYQKELNAVNFITVHKFTKYRSEDPRRARAKHLQDVTDYDIEPLLIAHFDYEFLSVTTSKFDAEHGVDTNHTEIFQHCILLQPPSSASLGTYFFATVSKCIGLAKSCLTIWSLIEHENDEFHTQCVQRLFFATPSVNTLITSMEYNRYSKPYILLSSTTFDPFQDDYVEAKKRYMLSRVVKETSQNAAWQKKLNEAFQEHSQKPVIYVDFTETTSTSTSASVSASNVAEDEALLSDDDAAAAAVARNQLQSPPFRSLFHSHILSLDWQFHTTLKTHAPFITTASFKADVSPAPLLVPCRSLYRFVENSLIGQKPQLKNLKLYSRRHTIGLLRIGIFAFKYFEFFTPEQIKVRRNTSSSASTSKTRTTDTKTLATAAAAADAVVVQKKSNTSKNKEIQRRQLKEKLAEQVRMNAMALAEKKQKSKQQKQSLKQASSVSDIEKSVITTPKSELSEASPSPSKTSSSMNGPRMASYLYAASSMASMTSDANDDAIGIVAQPPPQQQTQSNEEDSVQPTADKIEPAISATEHVDKTMPANTNTDTTASGFFRQLNAALQSQHQDLMGRFERKMEENLRRHERVLMERMTAFEQKRQEYEQEQRQSTAMYAKAIEQLASQWNENPPISRDEMQQVLTNVVSQVIMPRFSVFVMQMFKNFCNSWVFPTLEKHVHSTNHSVNQEIDIKMKNLQITFDEMLQKATAQITATASALSKTHSHSNGSGSGGGGGASSANVSAVLAESANAQIANLINKQLQEVLQLLNKSLSSTLNKHLQKTMVQIQREIGANQTSLSTAMKSAVADNVQQQFKVLAEEVQSMQQQIKVLTATTMTTATARASQSNFDLETLRHRLPAPPPPQQQQQQQPQQQSMAVMNDSFEVYDRKYAPPSSLPVHPQQQQQYHRPPPPSYNEPQNTQSLPPYFARGNHVDTYNAPPVRTSRSTQQQPQQHQQYAQWNSPSQQQQQQQQSMPDSVREQLAQLRMQVDRLSSAHSSSQQLQPIRSAPRLQSSWSVPAPTQPPPQQPQPQTYDAFSPFMQSSRQRQPSPPTHTAPPSFYTQNQVTQREQPPFSDNLSRHSQNMNGNENDDNNNNNENILNDLQGKLAQLMNEFQRKQGPTTTTTTTNNNNNGNNNNNNNNGNDTNVSSSSSNKHVSTQNDMDDDDSQKRRQQQTENLMQQYCEQNQPFQALSAMLKYKKFDLVIHLFDRFNMEALFNNGFARDVTKNKCVVNFDFLNQLIWYFTDLVNEADNDALVVKYLEWITLLMENISAKDIDFDINVLANTLNKIDNNLQRLSTIKSTVKSIKKATKYLSLLTEKWRNKIKK